MSDALSEREQRLVAGAYLDASKHMAADYNGAGYDWVCACGAVGHWSYAGAEPKDSWEVHICSLIPADAQTALERALALARLEGKKEGLRVFAWWKDGTQYVGSCGTTLKEALAKVDAELEAKLGKP